MGMEKEKTQSTAQDGNADFVWAPSVKEAIEASKAGRLETLEEWLSSGGTADQSDAEGETLLMYASYCGSLNAVDYLIRAGCDMEARCRQGMTAIMKAAYYGQIDCLRRLMSAGAKFDVADGSGETTLMFCIRGICDRSKEPSLKLCIEELLASGCGWDAKDRAGRDAMYYAKWQRFDWALAKLAVEREKRELGLSARGASSRARGASARI